jgi:hypothetical protein
MFSPKYFKQAMAKLYLIGLLGISLLQLHHAQKPVKNISPEQSHQLFLD